MYENAAAWLSVEVEELDFQRQVREHDDGRPSFYALERSVPTGAILTERTNTAGVSGMYAYPDAWYAGGSPQAAFEQAMDAIVNAKPMYTFDRILNTDCRCGCDTPTMARPHTCVWDGSCDVKCWA